MGTTRKGGKIPFLVSFFSYRFLGSPRGEPCEVCRRGCGPTSPHSSRCSACSPSCELALCCVLAMPPFLFVLSTTSTYSQTSVNLLSYSFSFSMNPNSLRPVGICNSLWDYLLFHTSLTSFFLILIFGSLQSSSSCLWMLSDLLCFTIDCVKVVVLCFCRPLVDAIVLSNSHWDCVLCVCQSFCVECHA